MFDPSEIKIIFFDAGNVFVSDDPSGCFAYEKLFEYINRSGQTLTAEEFFQIRTANASNGGLWGLVAKYVPESEFKTWQREVRAAMYCQWSKLSPPIAAMQAVPRLLAPHFRLGIIANQPAQMKDVLAERDLLQYFDVLAISDSLNLYKPDTALYQWALDAAKVSPAEALMVGDRIDNDIIPAKKLGMQTAWLRLGYDRRGWNPETEFQRHYADSIRKASYSEFEPTDEASAPDLTVHSAEELLSALLPHHAKAEAHT